MDILISVLIGSVAFYIGGLLLDGIKMKNFVQAVIVAVLVGVLDYTLGNVLKIVTLGFFSIGIFNWLLNAILIQIADYFLDGFKVKNFWWALALAAIVSIASTALNWII